MFQLLFNAFSEDEPGQKWQDNFEHHWPAYQKWFLSAGDQARPSYLESRRMLRQYMPELVPTYERLVELAGGGDLVARFLAFYNPPPYITGCSQAVWPDPYEPILVRNYDYSPRLCEASLLKTRWNDKNVIAMGDCLWGVLDGMNDSGLALSLSFGGRKAVGDGFGMPVILRYILEFCDSIDQAVDVLERVPTHMSYNVTLLDKSNRFKTVFLAPDKAPVVRQLAVATNHQGRIEWHRHANATSSLQREQFLSSRLMDTEETAEGFVRSFLYPPLYSYEYERGFGTVYTACYRPNRADMELRWLGSRWPQSFEHFIEDKRIIRFPSKVQPLEIGKC